MSKTIKPGDIVRHKEHGLYPSLAGHYGLVQVVSGNLGVEWDDISSLAPEIPGHDLNFRLLGDRAQSGWWVMLEDVEVL